MNAGEKNIDITKWSWDDRTVWYQHTKDKRVLAVITGEWLRQRTDGTLSAELVAIDHMWSTGVCSVSGMRDRGQGEFTWDFVKPPLAVRELEAKLAQIKAQEAAEAAREAREAADKAKLEAEESPFDNIGQQSIRDAGNAATSEAARLRRVAPGKA